MSEKRHKTKKIAIYQNVIVRNSLALGRHDFARPLLIALQVVSFI